MCGTPDAPVGTFEGDGNDGSLEYLNVDWSYVETFLSANNTPGGGKAIRMNQTYPVGPSKSLSVYPGDKVDIEVWEYHEGSSGFGTTSAPLTTLVNMVSGAFGGLSGGAGESGMIYGGVDQALSTFGVGANQGDARPAAYLNYILFDQDYRVLDAGWRLAPATTFTRQKLSFETLNIEQAGYVYVWLSYEDESNNWVYFDDLKVTHTKSRVLQYNEYYPFGMQTRQSWTREDTSNDFLYNSASELNRNTGWYETFFRGYDPVLGRFQQIDPMAYAASSHTPYNFAFNNPVLLNDPNGDYPPGTAEVLMGGGSGGLYSLGISGAGGSIHVDSGWGAEFRSVGMNYGLMSTSEFQSFYGVDLNTAEGKAWAGQHLAVAGPEAAAFAAEALGGSVSQNGQYIDLPNFEVLFENDNMVGLRALPSTWIKISEIGSAQQGGNGLWNAFAEGAANAKSDMIMPSAAMAGWAGIADLTNLAVRHDANHYTKFSNLRKVAQASKYVKMAGTTLGVAGVIVSGIESGLDENGFTWGDAAKLGVGASVTALAILGSPVLATGAVIYGVVDLGFGLFTEASLSDRLGAGIDNMIK